MLDWFVFTKKTALMQRLADLVRSGHVHYVAGQIPTEKAGFFAAKLDSCYEVGLSKLQSSRQRKIGKASFRLLMLAGNENPESLMWWLLMTNGDVPDAGKREKWRNALEDRITLTGYELVRQTRVGQVKPAYTWRYTKTRNQDLRDALVRAVRTKRDDELRKFDLPPVFRLPTGGFHATCFSIC